MLLKAEPAEQQRVLASRNPLEHKGSICPSEGCDVRADYGHSHTANGLAVAGLDHGALDTSHLLGG